MESNAISSPIKVRWCSRSRWSPCSANASTDPAAIYKPVHDARRKLGVALDARGLNIDGKETCHESTALVAPTVSSLVSSAPPFQSSAAGNA
jgi:hypothetical protein